MSDEELAKRANDFEEKHGYCPDYGYDVYEPERKTEAQEEASRLLNEWSVQATEVLNKTRKKR